MQKTILSTADIARLFRVTETTVKRWSDGGLLKCQKTPGGHRKFEIKHVFEFATTNNLEPVGALSLSGKDSQASQIELAVLVRDYDALTRIFIEKGLSPERTDLFKYFSYLYQHHIQLWEIFDNILGPGMHEIGSRWEQGQIGVSHEHKASYETLDALAKLQAQVLIKEPTGRSVICACLDEELHEMGLRCAAYLFESLGWNVHYLGARTPAGSLNSAIQELHPDVVCISLTTVEEGGKLQETLQLIHSSTRKVKGQLIVGGGGVSRMAGGEQVGDATYQTSKELAGYINGFRRS